MPALASRIRGRVAHLLSLSKGKVCHSVDQAQHWSPNFGLISWHCVRCAWKDFCSRESRAHPHAAARLNELPSNWMCILGIRNSLLAAFCREGRCPDSVRPLRGCAGKHHFDMSEQLELDPLLGIRHEATERYFKLDVPIWT